MRTTPPRVKESTPEADPTAVGANFTVTVHAAPAAIFPPQSPSRANPVEAAKDVTATAPVETLVSLIGRLDSVPTSVEAKFKAEGATLMS